MGRKKKPENNYFHEGVEEAIQLYNKSQSELERNRIFSSIIYPALAKIAEVMYNKIKPTYMDGEVQDIMMDCTAYLAERLYRVKQGKGKGFSYMTVCARNYYIFHNQRGYTGVKKVLKLDAIDENWDIAEDTFDRSAEMEQSAELLSSFVNYLKENKTKFIDTKKGNIVLDGLIEFLSNVDSIEDFNRRNIMNDLCEINGVKIDRHYITKVFNKLEMHYSLFRKEWNKTGKPMPFWVKNRLTQAETQFCIENYSPIKNNYSIVGLAKKFHVEEYAVRRELHKVGLASL